MIYDIQEYLRGYATELMSHTLAEGSHAYQAKIPAIIFTPAIMAMVAGLLIFVMTEMSKIMNRTIVNPILKLAEFAKRIAQNDFFIEDVPIENNDEVGELTHAFNKMKFATGEYIRANENGQIVVPSGAVVVAGSRPVSKGPGAEQGIHLYCPVIVKYRDDKTSGSITLEDMLR